MRYEVYDPKTGNTMKSTDDPACVDDEATIDAISRGPYKFKVDGKVTAKSNVYAAVAKSAGITVEAVKRAIKKQQNWGYECAHMKSEESTVVSIDDSTPKRKVTRIRCVETGEVYKNMTEAGKALGIDPASISDAVKLNRPRGGYHFERVES